MKFNRYKFPHPIAGVGNDFSTIPKLTYDLTTDDQKRRMYTAEILPNCNVIQSLINNNKAEIVWEVNCTYTLYRKIFKADATNPFKLKFHINKNEIKNNISHRCLIVAKEEVKNYYSENFNPRYKKNHFLIDKGDVLAVCKMFTEYFEGVGKSANDFIKITDNQDSLEHITIYDLDGDYLKIVLPKYNYDQFLQLKDNPDFFHLFISGIILPALQHAFYYFNEDGESIYGNRKWFETLKMLCDKHNYEIYPDIEQLNELGQMILNYPNSKFLENIDAFKSKLYTESQEE